MLNKHKIKRPRTKFASFNPAKISHLKKMMETNSPFPLSSRVLHRDEEDYANLEPDFDWEAWESEYNRSIQDRDY